MTRKNFIALLMGLGLAVPVGVGLPDLSAAAATGCCMERASEADPWLQSGLGFKDCRKRNRERDGGDDLVKPQGRVWWNLRC